MPIEQTLERIAVALETIAGNGNLQSITSETTAAPKATRAKKNTAAETETAPAPAPKATAAKAAPEPATDYPDYEEVKTITLALSKGKGRDTTMAILKKFNATVAPDLKPEQYQDYIDAANDALMV